jgi:hypothetical protein
VRDGVEADAVVVDRGARLEARGVGGERDDRAGERGDGDGLVAADVEGPPPRVGAPGGEGLEQAEDGLDGVVHVAEGAHVAPVAVEHERLPALHGAHEAGHHALVPRRVERGAVDVEEADHRAGEAPRRRGEGVVLGRPLGGRVAPALRRRRPVAPVARPRRAPLPPRPYTSLVLATTTGSDRASQARSTLRVPRMFTSSTSSGWAR